MPVYSIFSAQGEFLRRVECPANVAAHQVRDGERLEEGDTAASVGPVPVPVEREVRARRQGLLYASDWAVLPDAPVADRAAWVAYRQALRDLTSQPGFPDDVTWPTPPGAANSLPQVDAGS